HMQLLLRRSDEQQAAADLYVKQLNDKNSVNYHHWLTAAQFGQKFGPAAEDIAAVTGWVAAPVFKVNWGYPSGMMIDFSGSAGQVRSAFRTEIHRLNVGGESHVANMSDPEIPAALATVVRGVVSMHDFKPRVMSRAKPAFTYGSGSSQYQAVTP